MDCLVRRLACVAALVAGLGGCAEFTHLTRSRSLSPSNTSATAVLIDAKQRAVYATPLSETVTTDSWNPQTKGYDRRTRQATGVKLCAEPSPDAMSAIAASQGLDLTSRDDLSLAQAMSIAESAGSIGLRTQSIQLMRDAMYRICEGYASGALTHGAYETLHRRLQSSMVAILAIEQLTGAVRARQVVLGTSTSSGPPAVSETALADLRVAQAERRAANENYVASQIKYEEAKKAADEAREAGAEDADAKATTAAERKAEMEEKKALLEDADRVLNEARRAARAVSTTAAATGDFSVSDTGPNLDSQSVENVATAVKDIVNGALGLQFSNELCTTLLVGVAYREVDGGSSPVAKCNLLLDATKSSHDAETALLTGVTEYIAKNPNITPEQAIRLIEAARGGRPAPSPLLN